MAVVSRQGLGKKINKQQTNKNRHTKQTALPVASSLPAFSEKHISLKKKIKKKNPAASIKPQPSTPVLLPNHKSRRGENMTPAFLPLTRAADKARKEGRRTWEPWGRRGRGGLGKPRVPVRSRPPWLRPPPEDRGSQAPRHRSLPWFCLREC